MKKKGPTELANIRKDIAGKLQKVLTVLILWVLFCPPILRGLYFEDELMPMEILVFIGFILFGIIKLLKKERFSLTTPLDFAAFGFIPVYFISILASVSPRLAVAEFSKYCMYFAVFIMVSELALENNRIKSLIPKFISASAAAVSIIGIDGAAAGPLAGWINKFLRLLGWKSDLIFATFGTDNRITSTLQYANTLAAFLIAGFLVTLAIMMESAKPVGRCIGMASSLLILTAFAFTLSRGAYMVLPFALALFIILLAGKLRLKAFLWMLAAFIPPVVISGRISSIISANPPDRTRGIWTLVAAGAVISVILGLLLGILENALAKSRARANTPSGGRKKIPPVIIVISSLIVIAAAALFLSTHAPAKLVYQDNPEEGRTFIKKVVQLEGGRDYQLVYTAKAEAASGSSDTNNTQTNSADPLQDLYSVRIITRSEKNILLDQEQQILTVSKPGDLQEENNKVDFTVPEDSRVIYIYFNCTSPAGTLTVDNANIVDKVTGETVEKLTLKYKYLPYTITSRLEDLWATKSNLERFVFYRNGLQMYADHWLFGAGGGAWSLLYGMYQSYHYWTTQVHSYPVQLAIECGIPGILIFVFLILALGITLFKAFPKSRDNNIAEAALFAAALALLAHAIIDFDFSLSAVSLLFWELLALVNAGVRSKYQESPFIKFPSPKLSSRAKQSPISLLLIMLLTSVIFLIPTSLFLSSLENNVALKAYQNGNKDLALKFGEMAASTDFLNPNYQLNYASYLLEYTEDKQVGVKMADPYIIKARSLGMWDAVDVEQLGKYYMSNDRLEDGIEMAKRYVELRPLDVPRWQIKAEVYLQTALLRFSKEDSIQGLAYCDEGLQMINEAKTANDRNLNRFTFLPKTQETLERMKYLKDRLGPGVVIQLDRVAFYNVPQMDIDGNQVPDQWTAEGAVVKDENGVMQVEAEGQGYIQSRELYLQPGRHYKLSLQIAESSNADNMAFNLSGINEEWKPFDKGSEIDFSSEFEIPAGASIGSISLRLSLQGQVTIRNIELIDIT